jgi:mannose-6-phosphate isomerase-like protein (cupin superfamily)
MKTRRIVTGRDSAGRETVLYDGPAPRQFAFPQVADFGGAVLWATPAATDGDPTGEVTSFVPAPGETRLFVMTLPPDSAMADPDIDFAGLGAAQLAAMPGLAETFEPDGMHTTPTTDYAIVLSGSLVLELGSGERTRLEHGDVVVQQGVRHAWRNPGDAPVEVLFVLVGAPGAT